MVTACALRAGQTKFLAKQEIFVREHIAVVQDRKAQNYKAAKALLNSAEQAGRVLTASEKSTYDGLIQAMRDDEETIKQYAALANLDDAPRTKQTENSGMRRAARRRVEREVEEAQAQQFLSNMDAFCAWGVPGIDIRALSGSPLTESGYTVLVGTEILPYVSGVEYYDVAGQLGVRTYPTEDIRSQVIPILDAATAVSVVSELTDPGSAPPGLSDVVLTPAKYMAYTSLSFEAIRSLLATPGVDNGELSTVVTRALALGTLKQQNVDFLATLHDDVAGNSHAVSINDDADLLKTVARVQSSLALQFRENAVWLMGKTGQQTLQGAEDDYGRRLFPEMPDNLSGKRVVIAADLTGNEIYYGDFTTGSFRSLSALVVRLLTETLALNGANAWLAYQFGAFGNFAKNTTSTADQPVLLTSLTNGAS